MRRRELLIAWGGAMTVSRVVRAQQKAVPVIGILDVGDPAPLLKAFREGLQDKGYVEGQNIRLEIRSPVGSSKAAGNAASAFDAVGSRGHDYERVHQRDQPKNPAFPLADLCATARGP